MCKEVKNSNRTTKLMDLSPFPLLLNINQDFFSRKKKMLYLALPSNVSWSAESPWKCTFTEKLGTLVHLNLKTILHGF